MQWRRKTLRTEHKQREGFYKYQYFENEYHAIRRHIEDLLQGNKSYLSTQFEGQWTPDRENFVDWLLAQDQALGKPRSHWQKIVDSISLELGFTPSGPEMLSRWRLKTRLQSKRRGIYYRYETDAYLMIRRHLVEKSRGLTSKLQVQIVAGRWKMGSPFLPTNGDVLAWLTSEPMRLGKPRAYWQGLIDKAKAEISNGIPLQVEEKYRERPELSFGLDDLVGRYEVELSDELVKALQRVNQPYLSNPGWKKDNRIWQANHRLTKRLWGWCRYNRRGKSFEKDGYDHGAYVNLAQIQDELIAKTTLTRELVEQHSISIKRGTSGEMMRTALPITPNKWWAKLFGFYFSSGNATTRLRKRSHEIMFRFAINEDVMPMLIEVGEHIGAIPFERKSRPPATFTKAKTLRSRQRANLYFASIVLEVMKKFGLRIPITHYTHTGGRKPSSRIHLVSIPEWILKDDDFMHSFVEGYINGMKGHSQMSTTPRRHIITCVYIRFASEDEEEARTFGTHFKEYFERHAITGHFKHMISKTGRRTPRYEFSIHSKESLGRLLDDFEILRPDMRARLLLRKVIAQNQGFYEILRELSPQEKVLLGILFEAPRSREELGRSLLMRETERAKLIQSLLKRGLITRDFEDNYNLDVSIWMERFFARSNKGMTDLRNRIMNLSDRLIYQCTDDDCRQVYIRPRERCGICDSPVEPINRTKVLKPLGKRLARIRSRVNKIKKQERGEIQIAERNRTDTLCN